MTEGYVDLVTRRLQDRNANILTHVDELPEENLRFTVRLFADCLDEETRARLFGGYSEYWTETEIRAFVKEFLPAYLESALAELAEKKKEGERFDAPHLTQEEFQEMAVLEKWPKIAAAPGDVAPLQLRREIAKAGLLFRPYMLSDPAFNEGAVEFALYHDLLDRLAALAPDDLRKLASDIAPLLEKAVRAAAGEPEPILREVRLAVARRAGIEADPESLLGPRMERYPREGPRGWKVRNLGNTLKTMTLKDTRLSALAHLDLLTVEESREIVSPFMGRFRSFFEIPSKVLAELILEIAARVGDRSLTLFFERYAGGTMAMTPPVSWLVWKLMPEAEKIARLRQDNDRMDAAMMSRHLARYLLSPTPGELSDVGRQIALLMDENYSANHGSILKGAGGSDGLGVKKLYDEVTILSLRMASRAGGERQEIYDAIRRRIAAAAGLAGTPEKEEGRL